MRIPINGEALRNMLSKKREILLATLTVVSLVMVLGTGICAYSSWIALQRAVQQQSEALKKSQAEELLTRIQGAEQVLPMCHLTSAERAEIDSTLKKAINELKTNGDVQAAQALFARFPIGSCPDIVLPITTQTTVVTMATETTVVPATQVSLVFLLLFLVMTFVSYELAVAWRSEHVETRRAL
jgi:hypothetical protein